MRINRHIRIIVSVLLILGLAFSVNTAVFAGKPADDRARDACTSFVIGKDLTENGSYIWGRTEDYYPDYAKHFVVVPAAAHKVPDDMYESHVTSFTWNYPAQTMRYTACFEAMSNAIRNDYEYFGEEAYAEAGMNEKGVAVSATVTLSSPLDEIMEIDPFEQWDEEFPFEDITGIGEPDIPAMILMQAQTARQGCDTIAKIIDSAGAEWSEGFMVSDPNEVWFFQILSCHEYVAVKCPDDILGFTPNLTANVDNIYKIKGVGAGDYDGKNVIVSPGLFDTAKEAGTLVTDKDGNIKIADSYATPVNPEKLTRTWLGYNFLKSKTDADNIEAALSKGDGYIDFFISPRANAKTTKKYSLYEAMALFAERGHGTVKDVDSGDKAPDDKRTIGHIRNLESHIFEVRQGMPAELATVEWLCMGPTEFNVYLPFYGNLISKTFPSYSGPDSGCYDPDLDANSVYWVARELYMECIGAVEIDEEPNSNELRDKYGKGVKAFWERYQKELIKQQPAVDSYMKDVLAKEGRAAAEKAATRIALAISEEMYDYTNEILAEIKAFKEAEKTGAFVPSALSDPGAIPSYAFNAVTPGAKVAAIKTNNTLIIGGNEMKFPAAKIDGYNWLKLRDVAMILAETDKKFSVDFGAKANTVNLSAGGTYAPLGDELKDQLGKDITALISLQKIVLDGKTINIRAYNIDGYNYFRLRDLAKIFDIGVEYDSKSGNITLDLTKPYVEQ